MSTISWEQSVRVSLTMELRLKCFNSSSLSHSRYGFSSIQSTTPGRSGTLLTKPRTSKIAPATATVTTSSRLLNLVLAKWLRWTRTFYKKTPKINGELVSSKKRNTFENLSTWGVSINKRRTPLKIFLTGAISLTRIPMIRFTKLSNIFFLSNPDQV